MNFSDLLNDIDRLKGKRLGSLNKGSNLIVTKVNRAEEKVELTTLDGTHKTRPFSELRLLWDKLNQLPAVHVDSALGGSGSSRNQPETILANLPYIEYLRIDNKKHISLLQKDSHEIGTIRRMDPIAAETVKSQHRKRALTSTTSVIVVTGDIRIATQMFEDILGSPARPIGPGVYIKEHSGGELIIVLNSLVPKELRLGTHLVLRNRSTKENDLAFKIGERDFVLREVGDVTVLLENE